MEGSERRAVVVVCPISLEAIRTPVVLRGATFDALSIVRMVMAAPQRAASPRPLHPYARTPLTDDELAAVRDAALHDPEATRLLAAVGWVAILGGSPPSGSAPEELRSESGRKEMLLYATIGACIACALFVAALFDAFD
jgi:hypothetical protein